MAYPTKLLGDGETIAFEMRPHWRSLVLPVIWLLLVVFAGGFVMAWARGLDNAFGTIVFWVALAAVIVLVAVLFLRPVANWWTTLYVFTNRRILVRSGLIAKRGQDMPLSKLNNVEFSNTVVERFLNCGTLNIASGNDDDLIIANVPNVEVVQREVNRLHEEDDARRRHDYAPDTSARPADPHAFPPPATPPTPLPPPGQ